MGILLLSILVIGLIILIKMKPLQGFDEVKLGKLEFKKTPQDLERDKKQDDALSKLLEMVKALGDRLDGVDERLDANYKFIRKTATQAANAIIWSDRGAPYDETIQAGLFNLMLKQNSNLDNRIKEVIMGQPGGLQLFNSKLNNFVIDNKEMLDAEFYQRIKSITWGMK